MHIYSHLVTPLLTFVINPEHSFSILKESSAAMLERSPIRAGCFQGSR